MGKDENKIDELEIIEKEEFSLFAKFLGDLKKPSGKTALRFSKIQRFFSGQILGMRRLTTGEIYPSFWLAVDTGTVPMLLMILRTIRR
jgi:hypothetical protein